MPDNSSLHPDQPKKPGTPGLTDSDELSAEELEEAAGGALGDNSGCTNYNCPCSPE